MQRREFVRRLPVVTTGVFVGATSLSLGACAGLGYVDPRPVPGGLAVSSSLVEGMRMAFLQSHDMERPVLLWTNEESEVTAVLLSCTHRGCQPEPMLDRLVCPCHASEFSLAGEVLQGPAEEALARFEVTREGDDFVIWLERRVG